MNKDTLHLLANELQDSRGDWERWSRYNNSCQKDGTKWSEVDHLDYGDARGRYTAVLRVLRMMDIEGLVEEIITDRVA